MKNFLKNLRLTIYIIEGIFAFFRNVIRLLGPTEIKQLAINLQSNPFPLFLLILTVFICFTNYIPGTWLSGWDTLHPEFDFGLYFKRILSVWQEHQGLGAVASQAHVSELPRVVLYWLASLLLPASFLRYSYFFLTLILGPLGVYYFLNRLVFYNLAPFEKGAFSFSGALVYLLNLATLQHFYVPLEMFATHFATLGWLFLLAGLYLATGSRKHLFWFSIVTIFSTAVAHTPTLFYAYFLGLILFVVTLAAASFHQSIKRAFIVITATLVLNSFWLLPNIYFIFNDGREVAFSKIHTQFSDKAFLTGKKFGTVADTVILKNFLFDWGEYDEKKGQFVDLFDEWTPYLQSLPVLAIGYSVFVLVLVGIFITLKRVIERKKEIIGVSLLPIFVVSFLLIANDNFLSSSIYRFLIDDSAILKEALRFPFTKFSILLVFTYAVYFAIATRWLVGRFRPAVFRIASFVQALLVVIALSIYMLPAIGGNLISPSMKVKFPDSYFEMFTWFNIQEQGRIAPFPVDTFWGWVYYRWGYEGAGFRWFGLKQPILDREFDRWSPFNENYYWEISYALYSKNKNLFENVLEKYQVHWLLVDKSAINPSSPKSLYYDELEDLLGKSNKVALTKEFGDIQIYKVYLKTEEKSFVWLANNLSQVEPTYKWNNFDNAYFQNDNYFSGNEFGVNTRYYPFRSLFSGKRQEDLEFTVEDKGNYFSISNPISAEAGYYYLDLSKVDKSSDSSVDLQTQKIEVRIPKTPSAEFFPGENYTSIEQSFNTSIGNCNKANFGYIRNQIISEKGEKILRLIALDGNNCTVSFYLPDLSHKKAYLVKVVSRNVQGKSPIFWIENLNARKADIESYLPRNGSIKTSYFIQPPMEEDGLGYTLHLDNISIGRERTVNDIKEISIYQIPYNFLKDITLYSGENASVSEVAGNINNLEVEHPNPSLYLVDYKLISQSRPTLVLSQAFDKGWVAYEADSTISGLLPFLGKKVDEHVLVNNWENGWILPPQKTEGRITVFFLPQLLEYAGLALATILAIFLIFNGRIRR